MALTLAFMERNDFYPVTSGPLNHLSQWDLDNEKFLTARMEDMVLKPTEFMKNALAFAGKNPDAYQHVPEKLLTFKAMTGREVGERDNSNHLRSGDPNDWRFLLPDYIKVYIRLHYKDLLEKYYPQAMFDYPSKNLLQRWDQHIQKFKIKRPVSKK